MRSRVSGVPHVGNWVLVAPTAYEYAIADELGFVRREAQREADEAYADWQDRPSTGRFAVYRAAQDRADAAQDDLAAYVVRLAA